MRNFFEQVETSIPWPAMRRDLHWHLLPDPETAEYLAAAYREVTAHPGLEVVDPAWMHVTVLHAGPEAEVSEGEVADMVERVEELVAADEVEPVMLTLARPSPGTQALECAGRPGQAARRLWELTRQAAADVVGARWAPLPAGDYYPHLSLAYGGRDAERANRRRLKALLADIDQGEVTMVADRLVLVAQWHDGRRLVWEPVTAVPLTGREESGRADG